MTYELRGISGAETHTGGSNWDSYVYRNKQIASSTLVWQSKMTYKEGRRSF